MDLLKKAVWLVLLFSSPAFAQVTFVNSAAAHASNNTVVTTGSLATTAGDAVAVFCFQIGDQVIPLSMSDGAGNPYTHIPANDIKSNDGTMIISAWLNKSVVGGTVGSFNCTFPNTETSISVIVMHYSGNSTTYPLDVGTFPMNKGVWNNSANSGVTTSTFSTVNAQENIIACGMTSSTTQTFSAGNIAGSGAANLTTDGSGGSQMAACEDLQVAATETNQTGAISWSTSAQGGVDVISLSASTSCPPPVISSPVATSATGGQTLTMTWTTDIASDSMVGYGANSGENAGILTAVTDAGGVTSHTVAISSYPGAEYGVAVRSRNVVNALCTTRNQAWAFYGGGDSVQFVKTSNTASAGSFDYAIRVVGAENGGTSTQHDGGISTFLEIGINVMVGTYPANGLKIVVSGFPSNVSLLWPDPHYFGQSDLVESTTTITNDTVTIASMCCNSAMFQGADLRIATNSGGATTPGTYTLTITVSQANSSGAPTHTATASLVVDNPSAPYGIATSLFTHQHGAPPAIPNLTAYKNNFTTYGALQCAQDNLQATRGIRRSGYLQTVAASVASGSHSVLVQDTTQYSANTGTAIVVNFAPTHADYELVASGNWSVTDGTHLTITFGQSHTGPFTIQLNSFFYPSFGVQNGNWFYDGVRVFQNGAALVGQPLSTWQPCIDNVNELYRDWWVIFTLSGNFSGNYYFTHTDGIYQDSVNGGSANDSTAINDIDTNKYNFAGFGGTMGGVDYLQRETAYSLNNTENASLLGLNNAFHGQTTAFMRSYFLENVLHQMDQICAGQDAPYYESFMGGLEVDALLHARDNGVSDPRIPSIIKCIADYFWPSFNSTWNDPQTFPYDSWRLNAGVGSNISGGASQEQLNMLIAPMYGWLWMMTGNSTYQTEGDAIFNQAALLPTDGGPANIFTSAGNTGKLFNQQYYWGTRYVTARQDPATIPSDTDGPVITF